ncbi:hypothetical protein Zmor_023035 [Zophobas morio]|uniref:Uncharacterized protein n=1 Tax=Zophobas morio TaxID=2755281 RepID=A0AA38M749_9CUCU|nr:hypothetical protein Zmor_023035 [Zophobas morio]
MIAQQILPGTRKVQHLHQVLYMQDQISSHTAHINVVYLNQYFPAMLEWKVCTAPLACAFAGSKPLGIFSLYISSRLSVFKQYQLYKQRRAETSNPAILSSDFNSNADQHA